MHVFLSCHGTAETPLLGRKLTDRGHKMVSWVATTESSVAVQLVVVIDAYHKGRPFAAAAAAEEQTEFNVMLMK